MHHIAANHAHTVIQTHTSCTCHDKWVSAELIAFEGLYLPFIFLGQLWTLLAAKETPRLPQSIFLSRWSDALACPTAPLLQRRKWEPKILLMCLPAKHQVFRFWCQPGGGEVLMWPLMVEKRGGEYCNLTRLCCNLFWVWLSPAALLATNSFWCWFEKV